MAKNKAEHRLTKKDIPVWTTYDYETLSTEEFETEEICKQKRDEYSDKETDDNIRYQIEEKDGKAVILNKVKTIKHKIDFKEKYGVDFKELWGLNDVQK